MIASLVLATLLAQTELAPPRLVSALRMGLNAQRAAEYRPRITPGDGSFLVTWADYRSRVPSPRTTGGPVTGAMMRIGLDGIWLDASAMGLPVAPGAVVWTGEHWIVMSNDAFVRVDRDGRLLDPVARPLPTPIPTQSQMLAVAVGNVIIVAARDPREEVDNGRVVAIVHDLSMRRLQQYTLLVPAYAGGELLGMATDGETAMLLYRDGIHSRTPNQIPIRSAMFDRRGVLQSNAAIYTLAFNFAEVALGAKDEGYAFVVRTNDRAAIYEAVFIGRDNQVQFESPEFAGPEQRTQYAIAPTLTWDGTAFTFFHVLRSRTGPIDLFVTRIGADGTLDGPPVKTVPWEVLTDTTAIAAAWHDGTTLLTGPSILDNGNTYGERLLARAAADPKELGNAVATDLIIGALPQETPAVASSNTQSLVVWRERMRFASLIYPTFDVFATRVTDSGMVLDPTSIRVATTGTCPETSPLVTSDGTRFLVGWTDDTGVKVRQVRPDGRMGETKTVRGLAHCDVARAMKLTAASNGTDTLMVWTESSNFPARRVVGTRVNADGTRLDPENIVFGPTRDDTAIPRVASDGRDWLVAFENEAVRLGGNGVLLPGLITFGNDAQVEDVFWNGETYAAWVRYTSGEYRLFRISRDGSSPTVGDPLPATLDVPALNLAAKEFWCERGTCLAPHADQLLRVNPDLSVDLLNVDLDDERLTTLVGGVGSPLFVYVKRPPQRPFGGVSRVYVQGAKAARTRAVRHP